MEEKERRIREIMKDCKGQTIYSVVEGDVRFDGFEEESGLVKIYSEQVRASTPLFFPSGVCIFYPTKEFYERYLNGISAWKEWAREQNMKYTVKVTIESCAFDRGRIIRDYQATDSVDSLPLKECRQAIDDILKALHSFKKPS